MRVLNPRISEEKGLFPPLSGFSRCCSGLPEKGDKRQKKGEKGRLRPISRTGGQTPLKPPFVTPAFAAFQTQNIRNSSQGKNQGTSKKQGKEGQGKTLFLTLFLDFGPKEPGDSCLKWSLRSQPKSVCP